MPQSHLQEQVELIARHEAEFLARRTRLEKVGDDIASLVGSLSFAAVHLTIFLGWMAWNVIPATKHFDPPPFSFLGTLVALEGILLASLILMRQARFSRRAEERDHLMLQVLLLTEKEMTAVLKIDRKIAGELGLQRSADAPEIRELSEHISIDEVAQTIKDSLPTD